MSPRDIVRLLTPLGWLTAIIIAVIVLFVAGRGLGLRWDPFDISRRRLERAEAQVATTASDAAARRLEVEGATDQARRVDAHHQQSLELAHATAAATVQARTAHDANDPLDPARLARLRAHDGELCRAAPDLCASAAAGASAGGDHGMPAGATAGGGERG